jgi:hypothetical protein
MNEDESRSAVDALISPSIAPKVAAEAREVLATLATGEWRRSMRDRLAELEGVVAGWVGVEPAPQELKRITLGVIDLFRELHELPSEFFRLPSDRR